MPAQQHSTSKRNPPPGIAQDTHDIIWSVIEERHLISFVYDVKRRVAEPHDYGIRNGRVRLLVYQFAGESSSGRLPAWRLVDVEGVSELKILDTTFPGNRPVPSGHHHKWEQIFVRIREPGK